MDNTQRSASDGSWFLFGDWQGVTRIALPGDKVKTDCNLDRPNHTHPFAPRADGTLWFDGFVDLDPVALKAIKRATQTRWAPDPLGGEQPIEVGAAADAITVRGARLALTPSGDELSLGGAEGARAVYRSVAYEVFADGAVVIVGTDGPAILGACVTRDAGGAGRVAWCRPLALAPTGAPDAFREGGVTWLADHDRARGVAALVELRDDGAVRGPWSCAAVAGPWVHEGRVFWQPNDATLCAGATLGEAVHTWSIPDAHAGPGKLLRLAGRVLFLPWHRTSILDLAPAKKGKGEISRKHKAANEPMYRAAEELMRPLRAGMAKRGRRVDWIGCVRRGKTLEPFALIEGTPDVVAYALAYSLQDGARAKLAPLGVSAVTARGGTSYDDVLKGRDTTPDDVRALLSMLSDAGLSWASGLPYLKSVYEAGRERGARVPITPEAEDVILAAIVWAVTHDGPPPAPNDVPAPDAAAFAAMAKELSDSAKTRAKGIGRSNAGILAMFLGTRRFGAEPVAPIAAAVTALNPSFATEVAQLLG